MSMFDRRRTLAISSVNLANLETTQFSGLARNSWNGTRIALLTAGDDTQGMNTAIRAVVRAAIHLGCTVFYIKHGFKGIVEGGNNFEEATWNSTTDIIGTGGTILKSYKCPEFIERSGRLKAAKNLVDNSIHNIVAMGGDGTLKGINAFYNDWDSLLDELETRNLSEKVLIQRSRSIKIVCILASIINDVCNTDQTIGANSALHRIVETMDAISTTSSSSQLAFVLQVMGQTSGYLALATALMCDASMVFIPECPPVGNWRDELCDKVKDDIRLGSEGILCVMCEGAIDRQGKPITPEEVKDTLQTKLNLNVKITVLGHVQRGGSPSAYDRIIASRMGVEAVSSLKEIPVEAGPSVIVFTNSTVICLPLADVLGNTKKLEEFLHEKKFTDVIRLRGKNFQNLLNIYNLMQGLRSNVMPCVNVPGVTKIGIVRFGKSTISQCMVIRAIVGFCHSRNVTVLGISGGLLGIINRQFQLLCWEQVKRWTHRGTSCIDTCSTTAKSLGIEKIAEGLEDLNISGLILVGNFMAYQSLVEIHESKEKHIGLCIPMCMVPVTLANNIPGSEVSIGSDSALNEIIAYCDKMKRVARGKTNRVFVVETMGKDCGYLATMSGLCVGADAAYIKQERFTLDTLLADASHLRKKILHSGVKMGLIICSETYNANYDTDFIQRVFSEEGKGVYTCKAATIGHVQVGGLPSVLDRKMAVFAGVRSAEWIIKTIDLNAEMAGSAKMTHCALRTVLCFNKHGVVMTPIAQLICETDFANKVPTFLPWMRFRPMMRILAKHDANVELDYMSDVISEFGESDTNEYKPPIDI